MRYLLLICLVLLMSLSVVQAQTTPAEPIAVGENLVGHLTLDTPQASFTFEAAAGQIVTIQALAVTPGLAPAFVVVDATGTLVQPAGNPLSQSTVSQVVSFSAAGSYTILVRSANAVAGDVLVSITEGGTPPAPPTPLTEGQTIEDILDPGATIIYSFSGNIDPNIGLSPNLTSLDPVRGLSVELAMTDGRMLATSSNEVTRFNVTIPPNPQGSYLLTLTNDHAANVTIRYSLSLVTNSLVEAQPITATPVPLPATGPCVLTTLGQFVNLRQSPSTTAPIIATIVPTVIYNVTGHNEDTSWYQIAAPEGSGWVSASVTIRGGDCTAVPVVSQGPAVPPTATSAPGESTQEPESTAEATQPVEATAEVTPPVETTVEVTEAVSP